MVRARGAEDCNHAAKGGLGAGPHVQRLDRQPQGIDADQCSISRSQAAQDELLAIGQRICQRDGEVMNLIAGFLVDLTPMPGQLRTASQDFR